MAVQNISNLKIKMTITKINSKINGTMLKNKKRNKNSVPIIPLSTILLIAPVFLVK